MNTQSNTMPESFDSQPNRRPQLSPRPGHCYWSVRRELWENRSHLYRAAGGRGRDCLFGFLIATIGRGYVDATTRTKRRPCSQSRTTSLRLLIMGTAFLVGMFYCLDALHGERRDRSILFWKSLPVSDLTTVLSKASIPMVVLPLLSFAITVATQWIMLLLSTAVLLGSGLSVAPLGHTCRCFRCG